MTLPAASTLSVARSALVPSSVTTLPFTRTWPLRMSCSAWRREAMPARAICFWRRSLGMDIENRIENSKLGPAGDYTLGGPWLLTIRQTGERLGQSDLHTYSPAAALRDFSGSLNSDSSLECSLECSFTLSDDWAAGIGWRSGSASDE